MTQRCCFQPEERLANSNVVWMCDSYCGSEHLCGCQTQHICIPLSKTNAVMAVGILVLCVTSENMNNASTAFRRRDETTRSFMIVNDIQIEIIMNILMSIKYTLIYGNTYIHNYFIMNPLLFHAITKSKYHEFLHSANKQIHIKKPTE